ncbi:hypothetical protein NDU88_001292 [Pleurodeles waltl]|uniref:Uncharacterized protein n=1 Tax=Pleurodeles waltl TaxID=8319 RepID=A0AAV7NCZ1_PLEWA|nr:hypothetical protein NDU88_001292 [Pleurodeles waltl]
MEQYTTPASFPQQRQPKQGGAQGDQVPKLSTEEQSRTETLAAIQGSCVELEGKIETVVLEVNRFGADLQKVSDKVRVAKGCIDELQLVMAMLGRQVATGISKTRALEDAAQSEADIEGRYLLLQGTMDGKDITILNTCAPSMDDSYFYKKKPDLLEGSM